LVNEAEFLVDATGNRRFWIIPINQQINLGAVRDFRNAIWYQAKKAFFDGEHWYFNSVSQVFLKQPFRICLKFF
jgi:predicted P-loop ATPase